MTLVLASIDSLPECPTVGDDVLPATRAAAVAISESAEVMHKNAAPPEWEGDEATLAHHLMTSTAKKLDAPVAALEVGIAALDRFSDLVGGPLKQRHVELTRTRTTLSHNERELEPRLSKAADPTIEADVGSHNAAVAAFNRDVASWTKDLTDAEDTVIAALKKADTVREGSDLVSQVPNVPALVHRAEELRNDPSKVFAWWASLSRTEREALKAVRPEFIGNLDGIPLADRDEANRANLTALRESIREREGTDDFTSQDEDLLAKIKGVEKGLGRADGTGIPAYLMVFDPDAASGDGHAAVAFGNPETADHVTVNVPGLTSEMKNFGTVAGQAFSVYNATDHLGNGSVASIAWLGYDAPSGGGLDALDFAAVAKEDKASHGAVNLATFVDGLQATRDSDAKDMHVTVIGHSYGSTTVAIAAGDGMDADDIVLLGSPGAGDGNEHASDLRGTVYVGAADEDPVSRLGNSTPFGLGVDPATAGFGAHRFGVDAGHDFAWTPLGLKNGLDNHTGYFDAQSDSLADISKVAAGLPDQIHEVGGRGVTSDPGWWLRNNAGAPIDQALFPAAAAHQILDPYVDSALGHVRDTAADLAEQQRRMIDEAARRAGAVADDVKDGAADRVEDVGRFLSGLAPRSFPGIR